MASKEVPPWQIPASPFVALESITGKPRTRFLFDSDLQTVAYSVGNAVVCRKLHLEQGRQVGSDPYSPSSVTLGAARVLLGVDGGGIGAISINGRHKILAVGERRGDGLDGNGPNIYLYDLKTADLLCAPLQGGTERGYTDVNWR